MVDSFRRTIHPTIHQNQKRPASLSGAGRLEQVLCDSRSSRNRARGPPARVPAGRVRGHDQRNKLTSHGITLTTRSPMGPVKSLVTPQAILILSVYYCVIQMSTCEICRDVAQVYLPQCVY